jgi:hypothetical protein
LRGFVIPIGFLFSRHAGLVSSLSSQHYPRHRAGVAHAIDAPVGLDSGRNSTFFVVMVHVVILLCGGGR